MGEKRRDGETSIRFQNIRDFALENSPEIPRYIGGESPPPVVEPTSQVNAYQIENGKHAEAYGGVPIHATSAPAALGHCRAARIIASVDPDQVHEWREGDRCRRSSVSAERH